MQFTWLVPSLLFGLYLGISAGAWHMLVLSLGTAAVWFFVRRLNDSRVFDANEPVVFFDGEVLIGDYQLPHYEIFWKKEWHAKVYRAFRAQQAQPKFELKLNLETDVGHGIIIGPTGSGKSELLKLLLGQLIEKEPNCEVTLIDFKGGATFHQFANLLQIKAVVSDVDGHDPEELWQGLRAEVSRRELALAARGVSRIEELSQFGQQMPRHYILIDELAAALAESPLAQPALVAVAARGRSLGLHLLVATQSAQSVPRALITNLRVRIALADADPIELAQLNLRRPSEQIFTPPGWATGIVQKSDMLNSYFNFPLGARF